MVWVLLLQLLKQQVNRIFEIFIIFPCFTGIHQINQHGKILFFLRCFVPDICDQCRVIELFSFYPEILRGLLSFPFGIYNDCVYEFQNVLFAPDVSERVVMHRFCKVNGIKHLNPVIILRQHSAAFDQHSAFRISDHIGTVHLHKVRLHKKACLTGTGTANHKNVFIPCILRLLWSAGHHKTLRCR